MFLGYSLDLLTESGNCDIPGYVGLGMAETVRWAAEQLTGKRVAQHGTHNTQLWTPSEEERLAAHVREDLS
jgi:hypothetical protein